MKAFRDCVGAAVDQEMVDVLCFMENLNHPIASKATWLAVFRLSTQREKAQRKHQNSVILGIANQFEEDQRWEQVKGLFLLRYRMASFVRTCWRSFRTTISVWLLSLLSENGLGGRVIHGRRSTGRPRKGEQVAALSIPTASERNS
jgi:hypothetical protein